MRITVPDNVSFELGDEWTATMVQEFLGAFLKSIRNETFLHVRGFSSSIGHPLTKDGLIDFLKEQNWASPPYDVTASIGAMIIVAGTFDLAPNTVANGEVTREFYITDGKSVANTNLVCTRAQLKADLASAERLVATIRFS